MDRFLANDKEGTELYMLIHSKLVQFNFCQNSDFILLPVLQNV